jgi:hypothetical protein
MLLLTSTANAGKSFSMVGEWAMNRGVLVDIPINGGPNICVFKTTNALDLGTAADPGGCVGQGDHLPGFGFGRFPWPRTAAQVVFGFQQKNGGIPGSAAITTTGTNGSFTIPPGAFGQTFVGPTQVTATVMLVPTVVQLQTSLTAYGPASPGQASATSMVVSPTFLVQQPARMMANAWSQDVGQAGPGLPLVQIRPAADFQWCPGTLANGGAGGSCPGGAFTTSGPNMTGNVTGGTGTGLVDGILRYKAGANAFGGTMAMMLKGGGSTSVKFGSVTVAPTTMTLNGGGPISGGRTMLPLIAHLKFGDPPGSAAFGQPQVNGVGYAFNNTITLSSAPFHLDYKTSNSSLGVTTGGGMITASGPTGFGQAPGDTNNNWGFPWTTGDISNMNVELGPLLSAQTNTLTAKGSDNRDAQGNGTITLVAGGTANRILSGLDFAALEVVTMSFDDGLATPTMGPAGFATLTLLISLSAGFALRRRFASKA